jgi:hypothetical protein
MVLESRRQVLWALGFAGLGTSCGAREMTPSLSCRDCTLTLGSTRQPVATDGNGFLERRRPAPEPLRLVQTLQPAWRSNSIRADRSASSPTVAASTGRSDRSSRSSYRHARGQLDAPQSVSELLLGLSRLLPQPLCEMVLNGLVRPPPEDAELPTAKGTRDWHDSARSEGRKRMTNLDGIADPARSRVLRSGFTYLAGARRCNGAIR